MNRFFRDVLRAFGAGAPQPAFDPDDLRLAVAALLVHAKRVDGKTSGAENQKLRDLLGRRYHLAGEPLDALIREAREAEENAVDLYGFTSVIKRQMPVEERVTVVEDLWEIAFADGKAHEFEENLVWRAAELLGVSREQRLAAKFAAKSAGGGEPAFLGERSGS